MLAQYKSIVEKLYPNQEISKLLQLSHSALLDRLDWRSVGSPSETETDKTTSNSQFLALETVPHNPHMPLNANGCIDLLNCDEATQSMAIRTLPSTSQVADELGELCWQFEPGVFFPPIGLLGYEYL